MKKIRIVDAGFCSRLHWPNMSYCTINGAVKDCQCVLRDFFFCMAVLHCYNNKERKGEAVFVQHPIQTFS